MSLPLQSPKTAATAPATIILSAALVTAFRDVFDRSWKDVNGAKIPMEIFVTIVSENGEPKLINEKPAAGLAGEPDLANPAGQRIIGYFHTHPAKAGAAFSAGDVAGFITRCSRVPSLILSLIQTDGDRQFMYLRTGETAVRSVDNMQLKARYEPPLGRLYGMLKGQTAQPWRSATAAADRVMAVEFGLAYYEGLRGTLHRTSLKGLKSLKMP